MPITDVVRARTDHDAKERAAAALADMGMSISDSIRLLMLGVADRGGAPFEAKARNPIGSAAPAEIEGRQAEALARIADFISDLRRAGD